MNQIPSFLEPDSFDHLAISSEPTSTLSLQKAPPAIPSYSPTLQKRVSLAPDRLSVDVLQTSHKGSQQKPTEGPHVFRGFFTTSVGKAVPTTVAGSFRVLSYNVLAQRYVTSDKYPDCPLLALAEAHRSAIIARELNDYAPDVVAFQELSYDMFTGKELIGDVLRSRGYQGDYISITGSTGDDISGFGGKLSSSSPKVTPLRTDLEGVSIMFNPTRFERVTSHPTKYIVLNHHTAQNKALTPEERKKLLIASHNVALCIPLRCKVTDQIFVFATLHAFWDTSKPEGQIYQLERLLIEINDVRKAVIAEVGPSNVSLVILGDFNCEVTQPPLQYLTSGSLDLKASKVTPISCWEQESGITTEFAPKLKKTFGRNATKSAILQHPFRFESAYKEYWIRSEHSEHVTAVNPSQGFMGSVIDHILVEKGHLATLECGRVAPKRSKEGEMIPNASIPSDHYPVASTLIPTNLLRSLIATNSTEVDATLLQDALVKSETIHLDHSARNDCDEDTSPSWFKDAEAQVADATVPKF